MEFTVLHQPLNEALQRIQSIVERKNTIPILGNILCSVKNQELSLSATDLEVGIKISIPIQTHQEGKFTLSAKHFVDIVRELPKQEIHIKLKENHWVELICEKSTFNVVSLSANEYPSLPVFEEKKYFDVQSQILVDMIKKTEFAITTDTTRYNISGVCFEKRGNGMMRMTAMDGHRLSFIDQEIFLTMPELKRGIIIPKKGIIELCRQIEAESSEVGLAFERGYIYARLNKIYVFIRLIDGEYPDYKQVIPNESNQLVKINREKFSSALKRVSLLAQEKNKWVKLQLQKNLLTVFSSNPDMGEAKEEMDIDYHGQELEICFNSKYLLDYLNVISSQTLDFYLKDGESAGIFYAENQRNHTYVLMPMRV